jgi:hypothetical protein
VLVAAGAGAGHFHPEEKTVTPREAEEDIWRGEVANEIRHIARDIREVQRQLHELQSYIVQELAEHRAYHGANEHRWGLVKLCQMHPFKLAWLAAAVVAVALAGRVTPGWERIGAMIAGMFK